jgi:hypothetical protein
MQVLWTDLGREGCAGFPHPPHRSRRAALPHRAPASGEDDQASKSIWVRDMGGRREFGNQTLQLIPFQGKSWVVISFSHLILDSGLA